MKKEKASMRLARKMRVKWMDALKEPEARNCSARHFELRSACPWHLRSCQNKCATRNLVFAPRFPAALEITPRGGGE